MNSNYLYPATVVNFNWQCTRVSISRPAFAGTQLAEGGYRLSPTRRLVDRLEEFLGSQ
jgi:hypothetical protein